MDGLDEASDRAPYKFVFVGGQSGQRICQLNSVWSRQGLLRFLVMAATHRHSLSAVADASSPAAAASKSHRRATSVFVKTDKGHFHTADIVHAGWLDKLGGRFDSVCRNAWLALV
jgi:hypothetical protein